ncbi:respiratory nitrite reductase (cytochrome; ammonia-forming) precursor [Oscillochloris trichoides DG-6]|uniref:nitrite reductase (cytochrome; ammonia-forming) n=1 Tax=Oscillochloris trichoides DG-6 TaxID=765420 RepID=E1IBM3_9CHLR|nr:respiratory nitrite reductase (cytochrome; ammonia-forming) precursor [Oscillochloris trichoides DG-6]
MWAYLVAIGMVAVATVMVLLLLQNITTRQSEARLDVFRVVELDETVEDPAVWGQNYPRQYDSYLRTVDIDRSRYGGSESISKIDGEYAVWRTLWAGYPFATDYREERGHAYMLIDQRETERVLQFKQPGACLHCHASVIPAYYNQGVAAGIPADDRHAAIMKGFELINTMPYSQATTLVSHPVTCLDCHDPSTMQLRVTRPGFLLGIQALAESDDPVAHLPSIARWRDAGGKGIYDPNTWASRQELRSMVCAQCHVEYYFKGTEKLLTYPWQNGLKMEQIEAYYDEVGHKDWTHALSQAPALKAQHPEFELWSQGIHAQSGVACADCHMPYRRDGAVKISDHQVRSPLLAGATACQTCHNIDAETLIQRVETIQDRTMSLLHRGETATEALIKDIEAALAAGVPVEQLAEAQAHQRRAQWRLDFISAENSMGFHADQEAARILAEAIDEARQGQLVVMQVRARVGM